jgi:D-arabinose 1-dehydrogenase-like Zn-dependent alcohol dehydrogenase
MTPPVNAPVRALVLERKGELALRDIPLPGHLGPGCVRIRVHTVGVCGSDVHYFQHGRIGDFVVGAPWCWATRARAPSWRSARA